MKPACSCYVPISENLNTKMDHLLSELHASCLLHAMEDDTRKKKWPIQTSSAQTGRTREAALESSNRPASTPDALFALRSKLERKGQVQLKRNLPSVNRN